MRTRFGPSLLLLPRSRLRLMRLMFSSLLVLLLYASPILLMTYLKVGTVGLIVAEIVAGSGNLYC